MTGTGLADVFSTVWRWWLGELQGLVPRRFARGRRRRRKAIVLSRRGHGVLAERRYKARREPIAILEPAPERAARSPEVIRIQEARRRGYTLGWHLDPEEVLTRTLRLPAGAENDLGQVVAHQIDQIAPFPRDRVRFGHAVVDRDIKANMIEVRVVIAPSAVVENALATARALDLAPDYVDVEGPHWGELDLLAADSSRPSGTTARINAWLLAVNVVLLGLAIAVPIIGWELAQRDLEHRIELAATEVRIVSALRTKIDTLQQEQAFLAQRRSAMPAPLRVLDDLSAAVPDDTWLETLTLRPGEVVVAGRSSRAADLLAILQSAPMFDRVEFDGPIVKDEETQRERFRLRLSFQWPEAR